VAYAADLFDDSACKTGLVAGRPCCATCSCFAGQIQACVQRMTAHTELSPGHALEKHELAYLKPSDSILRLRFGG